MSYRKTYAMRIDELNHRIETAFGYRYGEFDKHLKTPDTLEEYDEFRFAFDFDNDDLKITPSAKSAKKIVTSTTATGEPSRSYRDSKKEELEDDILEYLIFAYTDGIDAVNEMLTGDVKVDEEKLFQALERKTAGKDYRQRIDEHIANGDMAGVKKVAETEFHRIFNEALKDGGTEAKAKSKTWKTMMDEKVRDTHSFLEDVTIPFDEKFHTYDGDEAMYPGDFADAENNVNCRCYIELTH